MSLDITEHEREGVRVVELRGRLVAGEESTRLRDRIRELAADGPVNIILDLRDVGFIDSTGLGGMVICYTTVRKAGGTVKLLNLSKKNIELLILTKLTTVFEVFTDEQEAVNSFFPGRETKKFDILSFVQQNQKI